VWSWTTLRGIGGGAGMRAVAVDAGIAWANGSRPPVVALGWLRWLSSFVSGVVVGVHGVRQQ
jgi:uncharacterized membrane protein